MNYDEYGDVESINTSGNLNESLDQTNMSTSIARIESSPKQVTQKNSINYNNIVKNKNFFGKFKKEN